MKAEEFAKAVNTHGGASVHIATGAEPTTGFMASVGGTEHVVEGDLSSSDVEGYTSHVQRTDAFLGGWQYEGHSYVDTSHRFTNEKDANDWAGEQGQIAQYDVKRDRSIQVQPQLPTMYGQIHPQGVTPAGVKGGKIVRRKNW